jgi:UDP-N-acetylmuramate--alanine ligase
VITGKKILIVGAGNAGRPAANLLNYLGNEVRVSDNKNFNSLPKKARKKIKELEKKGVNFELGTHIFDSVKWADAIFISPNIPEDSDIYKFIERTSKNKEITKITTSDIGKILNSLIKIPMVGIAGTDGKTTTTNMINYALEEYFNTLVFSSLEDSLVIEGLVELVVNEETQSKDFAIFELPHGTIRMAEGLELCSGVVTNLTPDHMDEFDSYEDYIQRNFSIKDLIHPSGVLIMNGDDPVISNRLDQLPTEKVLYGLGNSQSLEYEWDLYDPVEIDLNVTATDIDLKGLDGSSFTFISNKIPTALCANCGKIPCQCGDFQRKYAGPFNISMHLKVPGSLNIENALATLATGLVLGLELDSIKTRLESFPGIKGRFEKIDNVNGVNIFMDAAHNPESMEKLLAGLDISGRLIISLDNPDTLTNRDKFKIGQIIGKNADVIISSAKNETTEEIDFNASKEVLDGAEAIESYITDSVTKSMAMALEMATDGDTILHIGPGVVNAYSTVKNDIIRGIKSFKESTSKVVVIGGCGTVGSLMARVLKHHGADVTVSDSAKDTPLRGVFQSEGINLDLGGHSEQVLKEADTIVMAPSLLKNQTLIDKIKNVTDADIISVKEVLDFCKVNKSVLGVTGTNGKTTTTNILKNILKTAEINVPDHHLNIQGNTELIPALQARLKGDMAVVEIGTFGKPQEIKKLALISEVDVGIVTNISRDHLSEDYDFSEYINCKKEIGDVADLLVLNADDPLVADFSRNRNPDKIIFYGIGSMDTETIPFPEGRECPSCSALINYTEHYLGHMGDYKCLCDYKRPEPDVMALQVRDDNFILAIGPNMTRIKLKKGGICNVYNSLAAAAGAWAMGIDFDHIVKGIEEFEGVEGRFEELKKEPLIISDFAHNPAGVKAAIQSILGFKLKDSRLIVVNTISSESGSEGDLEIAQILNHADIIVPASFAAKESSTHIKKTILETKASHEKKKIGTVGASRAQVEEGLLKALEISNDNDIILIIGEGGVKYSKEILEKLSI